MHTEEQPELDAQSLQFLQNPYASFARYHAAGIGRVGPPYNTVWVFSHKLVTEVNQRADVFQKPGGTRGSDDKKPLSAVNHLDDGLFFLDGKRHAEVRTIMDGAFKAAVQGAEATAQKSAEELLSDALAGTGQMEAIRGYAGRLAMQVFFSVMGIEPGKDNAEWGVVDSWLRKALDAHCATLPDLLRVEGATTTMAMRPYFLGLCEAAKKARDPKAAPTIISGMAPHVGCPRSAEKMNPDEAMNTASHMALGGYLSTQFLIGSGLYNLLRHPDQWHALREQPSLMPRAIDEMLRYDAPFQLADRWVAEDTELGGMALKKGQVIAVVYGSANRDPAFCKDHPDRFDITRSNLPAPSNYWGEGIAPTTPNLGFGDGAHRCIGEHLGRVVTTAAIEAMIKLCPNVRLGEVGPWGLDPYFRSLTRLQLLLH